MATSGFPSRLAGCSYFEDLYAMDAMTHNELPPWARHSMALALGPNKEVIKARFYIGWSRLAPENWPQPAKSEKHHLYGMDFYRFAILAVAVESATKFTNFNGEFGRIHAAQKELLSINKKIVKASADLAKLHMQRVQIIETYALIDMPEEKSNPFDLWDVLTVLLKEQGHSDFSESIAEIYEKLLEQHFQNDAFILPDWGECLERVGKSGKKEITPVRASDKAVLKSRKTVKWAAAGRHLIGGLKAYGLLKLLSNKQLTDLAEVAFDAPVGAFNESQIRELVNRTKTIRRI